MQPVLTPEAAAEVDARADVPVPVLMERAGLAVAIEAVRMGVGYGDRVVVAAGPGHNGGDGYVVARHLRRRGVAVEVSALAPPRSEASRRARAAAEREGVPVRSWGSPPPADLLVDALFGVGFRGALPAEVAPWTESTAPVLAVDVPSGLDAATGRVAGPAFTAQRTVAFHALKTGHLLGEGPERSGELAVADIGLEGGEPAFLLCEDSDAPRPPRPRTAHKWSAGSVIVVGGSPGITGAAMLAARSALTGGAGAAAVCCPGALQPWYESMAPDVLTVGVGKQERFTGADAQEVLEAAARYDVLALGPGLGRDQEDLVGAVLEGWPKGLVIDADGLNAVGRPDRLARRDAPTVLTPHAGEFRRLSGREPDHAQASAFAQETGTVVVLKGNPTFVMGRERWVVTSGGPELASIGTGDVLTGFLSALWARGLEPETAARSAAHWHGRAGSHLAARGTVTASLLGEEIAGLAW